MLAAGDVATAAAWNVLVGNDVTFSPIAGAWTSYAPALSNTWANGNATAVGYYLQVGKTVIVKGYIVIGSTTTKGASGAQISLPVNSVALVLGADEFGPNFSGVALDTGVAAYPLSFSRASASTISPLVQNATGTYVSGLGAVTSVVPFAWGTGDSIQFAGVYEAA